MLSIYVNKDNTASLEFARMLLDQMDIITNPAQLRFEDDGYVDLMKFIYGVGQ